MRLATNRRDTSVVVPVDCGGQEIFEGARRGFGQYSPRQSDATFLAHNEDSLSQHLKSMQGSTPEQPAFFGNMRSTRAPNGAGSPRTSGSQWRKGDLLPISLDGSHPSPRIPNSSARKQFPEFNGYEPPRGVRQGYGLSMIFGPEAASVHQVAPPRMPGAQMKLSDGPFDPHPFTLNGRIPEKSPSQSPRRQMHDLMMQIDPRDPLGGELARKEVQRRTVGLQHPVYPPPDLTPRVGQTAGSEWRLGDDVPFAMDGSIVPPRTRVVPRTEWRGGDKGPLVLGDHRQKNMQEVASGRSGEVDEEVSFYHRLLCDKLSSRFGELRRAFRMIDDDHSGKCDRRELKEMLNAMFNLDVPETIMDRIIDLADKDRDGSIGLEEFTALFSKYDVQHTNDEDQYGLPDVVRAETGLGLLKQGEVEDAVRLVHEQQGAMLSHMSIDDQVAHYRRALQAKFASRFSQLRRAFRLIDGDHNNRCDRQELKGMLNSMFNLAIPEQVLDRMIDLADTDGDGSIGWDEFAAVFTSHETGINSY
jgi:Ca2+-binding EF-hand superfamily protein